MSTDGKGESYILSTKASLVGGKRYRISFHFLWLNNHSSSHFLFFLSSLPPFFLSIFPSYHPLLLHYIHPSITLSSFDLFTLPSIHSSIHPFFLPSILPFPILPSSHSLFHSIHFPSHSFIFSSSLSFIHSILPLFTLFPSIHPPIHLSIHPSIHPFIHPSVQLTFIYTHPFSAPSVAMSEAALSYYYTCAGLDLLLLFILFYLKNFYWSIVDLQCCVIFCCTAKWIGYTYTYIHSFLDSFPM